MADQVQLYGAVAEYVRRTYGGDFEVRDSSVTVGVAAQDLVGANPNRAALVIVNNSVNTLRVAVRSEPSASNGIVLNASGGLLALNMIEDLLLPSYGWRAIASGAGSQVYVLEVILFSHN